MKEFLQRHSRVECPHYLAFLSRDKCSISYSTSSPDSPMPSADFMNTEGTHQVSGGSRVTLCAELQRSQWVSLHNSFLQRDVCPQSQWVNGVVATVQDKHRDPHHPPAVQDAGFRTAGVCGQLSWSLGYVSPVLPAGTAKESIGYETTGAVWKF